MQRLVYTLTQLLLVILLISLLVCCDQIEGFLGPAEESSIVEESEPAKESDTAAENTKETATFPELSSLTITVDGEKILLLDRSDPVTRSYYSAPTWAAGERLAVELLNHETDEITTVYAYPEYSYPLFSFGEKGYKDKLIMADQLQETASFSDFIERNTYTGQGGFLITREGVPVGTAQWEDTTQAAQPKNIQRLFTEDMLQMSDVEKVFATSFETSDAFIMTDKIQEGLLERGFILDNTKVQGGCFFSAHSYIFSDGQQELLYTVSGSMETPWPTFTFLSPEECAEYLTVQNTPQQVNEENVDQLIVDAVDSLYLSNGSFYKHVTDTQDISKVIEQMQRYNTLYDKAEAKLSGEPTVQVLVNETLIFRFTTQGDIGYFSSHCKGLCTAEKEWVSGVIALYDTLEYEERPQGEFEELALQILPPTGKPVIYLYPEKKTKVSVKLEFDGQLTYTYPTYKDGWEVEAYPDGRLINIEDQSEHYYLFWEGTSSHAWSLDSGFVVAGKDTEEFLREALAYMGLTPREYNDFIVYWMPQMQGNAYNLISFSSLEEYSPVARLTVHPKPDSTLRVHMAWMALEEPVQIPKQVLPIFQREGFAVVEWGGTEVLSAQHQRFS